MAKMTIELETDYPDQVSQVYEMVLSLMICHFPDRAIRIWAPKPKALKDDDLKKQPGV